MDTATRDRDLRQLDFHVRRLIEDHEERLVVAEHQDEVDATGIGAINLGEDWSDGDLLGSRVTTPPTAHKMDLREGTGSSPATIGTTASISRTDATTRASVNSMGPEGTDGPDGGTALRVTIKGTAASQVQILAGVFTAWQTGTEGKGGSADAGALYGFTRVTGSATGRSIPIYLESSRETATSGGQQAAELRVKNESGSSDAYVAGSASKSMGMWINPSGGFDSAAGIQFGHGFSRQFDVGVGFNELSIKSAAYRDDSEALRSVFIRGKHEKGAIVVNKESGHVIIGREEPQQATPLLEVFAESTTDPIVSFGSNTGASHRSQLIRNSTGNLGAFASNATNGFLTGTVQGDTGLTFTAGKTFHIGATGKGSIFRMEELKIGLFGVAPVARAAAITSPEAVAASLKTAVDSIRTALKNIGITE